MIKINSYRIDHLVAPILSAFLNSKEETDLSTPYDILVALDDFSEHVTTLVELTIICLLDYPNSIPASRGAGLKDVKDENLNVAAESIADLVLDDPKAAETIYFLTLTLEKEFKSVDIIKANSSSLIVIGK